MRAKDKVVVVTGASMGIGEAIASVFLREGAKVALCSRDLRRAEAARNRLGDVERTFAVACDVADPLQVAGLVKAVLSKYGRIDVWVNNAGQGLLDFVEHMSMPDCHRLFETNLFGAIHGMQAVIPVMRAQKAGTIINISSVAGHIAVPGMAAYSASKHALNAIGKAARLELASSGVRVITVCPGYIATDFGQNAMKGDAPQRISAAKNRISTERCARAVFRGYLLNSREVVVPWRDRIIIWVYQSAPWLIETAMVRLLKPAEQVHSQGAS